MKPEEQEARLLQFAWDVLHAMEASTEWDADLMDYIAQRAYFHELADPRSGMFRLTF